LGLPGSGHSHNEATQQFTPTSALRRRPLRRLALHRFGERLINAVKQEPCALVRHPHVARGSRNRSCVSNAFEQRGFTGANSCTGLENNADPYLCHGATVSYPKRRAKAALLPSKTFKSYTTLF
jgi:hypothetical protein